MRQTSRSILIKLLILFMGLHGAGILLCGQAASPTPRELDQLLAPIALYPDALLSQITTASTNPQEILDVHAWLQANPGMTGAALTDAAEKQGFDPAFIALVNFPQVLEMMAQHVDDYAAIGQAFSADQGTVTAAIQRLRAQAYDSGALRTTEQQKVEVQQSAGQTIYAVQPANPTVVYVPVYDPTVVYVRPVPGAVIAAPRVTFHVGIGIVPLIVDNRPWGWSGWGWNWRGQRAHYNHGYWDGWGNPYRPPHYWYHPRPVVWANRPGYRGNWGYRPPNYRPPHYRPVRNPVPRHGRGNPSGGNHPSPGFPATPGKPANSNPAKPAPDRPSGRPGRRGTPSKPDRGRIGLGQPTAPGENQPTRPDQPSGKPNQPGAAPQPSPNRPKPSLPSGPGENRPGRPDRTPAKQNRPDTPPQLDSNAPRRSRQRDSGQSGQSVRQPS